LHLILYFKIWNTILQTNLSNTTGSDSQDAEIAAEGVNVIVTWWERNQTPNEPVARISTDNGPSVAPLLVLATNGTIGKAAKKAPEGGVRRTNR
jgi:hypothetical protein